MSTAPEIEIFPVTALDDVELLRPVMEDAVRHPLTHEVIHEEIDDNLRSIEASKQPGSDSYFAVARIGDQVVGSMGLEPPIPELRRLATTDNPIELVNAYVAKAFRGQGVGRLLVHHLEDRATANGHTELLLNSGPRYRLSGWRFWREMYGEPFGVLKDHYGPRFDAMVWRTDLHSGRPGQ